MPRSADVTGDGLSDANRVFAEDRFCIILTVGASATRAFAGRAARSCDWNMLDPARRSV